MRTGPVSCLVINPRSFTVASSRLAARAIALAKAHGAEVIEADQPPHFEAGLDAAADRARFHVTERGICLVTPEMVGTA